MYWQLLMQNFVLAFGVLAAGVAAQAQPPAQSTRPQPSPAQGPVMYGPLPNYGLLPTYQGASWRRSDERGVRFVSFIPRVDSPIFFTSINYPGVYGSHTIGVAARSTASWPRMSYYAPAAGISARDAGAFDTAPQLETLEPLTSAATLRVQVPTADAEVYLNGVRMRQTGTKRDFETSVLLASRDYTYDVRVEWKGIDDRNYVREGRVTLRAGDNVAVDMTPPTAEVPDKMTSPTLRTMPLPVRPRQ